MADHTEQKIAAYLRDLLARGPQVPEPQRELEQKQEQRVEVENEQRPTRSLTP